MEGVCEGGGGLRGRSGGGRRSALSCFCTALSTDRLSIKLRAGPPPPPPPPPLILPLSLCRVGGDDSRCCLVLIRAHCSLRCYLWPPRRVYTSSAPALVALCELQCRTGPKIQLNSSSTANDKFEEPEIMSISPEFLT